MCLTDFLLFAFNVFNRFCFLLLLMLFFCECRNGFVRFCFSFIIDIISLVFVLLFQFPYSLTRFTLCNVAIYSMYSYLRWLSRSFCFFNYILLLIRFLFSRRHHSIAYKIRFFSSFSLMCVYFQALFNVSLRSAE